MSGCDGYGLTYSSGAHSFNFPTAPSYKQTSYFEKNCHANIGKTKLGSVEKETGYIPIYYNTQLYRQSLALPKDAQIKFI